MNKVILIVGAVAIVAGGYFGGQAMGLFGKKAMSADEISAILAVRAEEINGAEGLKYDDWSQLDRAVHVEKQLTVYASSLLNFDQLSGGADAYLESRVAQAANMLCNNETAAAAITHGARYVYNWKSADGEEIGMVSAGGETYCADNGH